VERHILADFKPLGQVMWLSLGEGLMANVRDTLTYEKNASSLLEITMLAMEGLQRDSNGRADKSITPLGKR
jgi:hypothetical protein